MQNEKIENYIEFLLNTALKKCGDIHDAEDLTQETLLAALSYISKDKTVDDMRAWLTVVLNRKYNDMLRRKYRKPTVSIGEGFDVIDDNANIDFVDKNEEAENLRKAVAHLAKIYREAIVRYYMNGQSVSQIAKELNIPEGTVKSRLNLGRNRVKKGIDNMEKYSNQSYQPVTLIIGSSGMPGINNEPHSLVEKDLIAQNILWLAYRKPLTAEEISLSIGIAAAYTEPIIQKLVDSELMKQVGNKYYTDFIIFTVEDKERYIPAQKQLVKVNFNLFWKSIEKGLIKIRKKDFYNRLTFDEKNSLELYFTFNCLDNGIYDTFLKVTNSEQNFPERPNGGRWIAFGNVEPQDFDYKKHIELFSSFYTGERIVKRENQYLDTKLLEMHVYGTDGFPSYIYHRMPKDITLPDNIFFDSELTKLLYIIHNQIPSEQAGFNSEFLKTIPWLTKCKILRNGNGKPVVNIPILNTSESSSLFDICKESRNMLIDDIKDLLAEFLKDKKQIIPPHLCSVPLQKQYLYSIYAINMAVIRQAMKHGKLYDGNYDDDSNGINQPPCPMILIIDK